MTLGFLGRLHAQKGVDLLMESLSFLVKERQDFQFWIAGEGAERRQLEQRVKRLHLNSVVQFLGEIF